LAMEYFQKAKQLSPETLRTKRLGILECYWHMEEYEEFQGEFLSISDQLEERDRAYYAALSHCKVGGDPVQGVRLLGKAIEMRGIDGILAGRIWTATGPGRQENSSAQMDQAGFKVCPGPQRTNGPSGRTLSTGAGEARKSPRYLSPIGKTYLKEHPEDNRARFQMAQALLKAGKFVDAQKHLLKLLTKGYSTENLLRALAWTYRKLGDYNEAYLVYQQLLQQSPTQAHLYVPPMLLCLIKLGNHHTGRAYQQASRRKEQGVPSPGLFSRLQTYSLKPGLLEQAMNLWRKASQNGTSLIPYRFGRDGPHLCSPRAKRSWPKNLPKLTRQNCANLNNSLHYQA
jgi:tetratricopeptide (TPR) repeat protein